MSSRNASTLGQTRERIIILLVALSVPLIVQFFLYILANAAGATSLPVVGYGISACAAAACTANGVERDMAPGRPDPPDGAADAAQHGAPLHRRDSDGHRGDKAGRKPARDKGGLGEIEGERSSLSPSFIRQNGS